MVAPLAMLGLSLAANVANGIAGSASKGAGAEKTRTTAQDFETMFLEQTLERVFASSGTEGPLGDNGTGGAVYRSMLVKEYAGGIAKSGGVGIASQIYRELLKLQEGPHARNA